MGVSRRIDRLGVFVARQRWMVIAMNNKGTPPPERTATMPELAKQSVTAWMDDYAR